MPRALTHLFPGGTCSYVEAPDEAMVRRIAEVLARNIEEIDDLTVVEEIVACFEEPASIETAETAVGLYCEAVPQEGFTLSISRETTVEAGDEPPPLAYSVARMRRHIDAIRND